MMVFFLVISAFPAEPSDTKSIDGELIKKCNSINSENVSVNRKT